MDKDHSNDGLAALVRSIELKHREKIGTFSLICTLLDSTIEDVLLGLLNLDTRYGAAVVRYVNLNTQRDLIQVLADDLYGPKSEVAKELKTLLKDAAEISNFRNNHLHGWHQYHDAGLIRTMNLKRGKLKPQITISSMELIDSTIRLAIHVVNQFDQLMKIGKVPSPLPARKGHTSSLAEALLSQVHDRNEQGSLDPHQSSQE